LEGRHRAGLFIDARTNPSTSPGRKNLTHSAGSTLVVCYLDRSTQGEIEMASTADLAELSVGDFSPHLDTIFDMQAPGGTIALKLAEATASGQSRRASGSFSLLFVAPAGPWLPQAIYPLQHKALGSMEIFLVPIGPVPGGNGYQAVFA
jgi:hypothetical protein